MPNIALVLKDEIARVARKEMRAEVAALKKSAATHRSEIANLRRRLTAAENALKRLQRVSPTPTRADADKPPSTRVRFSSKGLASQRKRLGLSAEDVGLLVGASSQSIYNWERGSARPRAAHLQALSALKTLGKKSAAAILENRRGAA